MKAPGAEDGKSAVRPLSPNTEFLCTAEHSTPENLRPIISTVNDKGITLVGEDYKISEGARATLAAAVDAARGRAAPPTAKVGFGGE
jgi:hypothetical protein